MAISGRTGWFIFGGVFLACLIAGSVFMLNIYRDVKGVMKDTFALPPELEAYASDSSARALLTSTTTAPPDSTAADSVAMALYIASLDSSFIGSRLQREAAGALEEHKTFDENVLREIGDLAKSEVRKEATTRRAFVNFLNAHDISLERYRWMKLRTIAAARITRVEADSAVLVSRMWDQSTRNTYAERSTYSDELFDDLDDLRDVISPAEVILATPHRNRILDNAVPDLESIYPYL